MPYKIVRNESGLWAVVVGSVIISEHQTNAQAWKALDRLTMEAQSPMELKADFVKAVDNHETRQQWYSAFLKIAHNKGRHPGWAAHSFKAKFGCWPDGLRDELGPVFPAVSMFLRNLAR